VRWAISTEPIRRSLVIGVRAVSYVGRCRLDGLARAVTLAADLGTHGEAFSVPRPPQPARVSGSMATTGPSAPLGPISV
jgi:hypothetical protein